MRSTLVAALRALKLNLPEVTLDRIIFFFELLLARNTSLNLISSRSDRTTLVVNHLVDSLTPLLWADWPDQARVLDIGAGAGLPALPLALIKPDWHWFLAEATTKKAAFLKETVTALNLPNVEIWPSFLVPAHNMENLFFDLITARAVANLGRLASLAGPRLKKNGQWLAFKGPRADQELKEGRRELNKWKLELIRRLDFTLPILGSRRSLLLFRRI